MVATYDQRQLKVLLKGKLVRDQEVTVAQQLRNRLDEESTSCTRAALLLSRPAVEFFAGSMPPAEEHEMPALVENFVAQEIDDSEDRVIDYVITGGDRETTTDVLAMTCERRIVETAAKEFKEAGFKLQAATYNGFGGVQLIHQVAHQKLPITVAITSADSSTEIAVLQQRQPVLFRTIQRGVEPGEPYASALAAEVQRTLAFIGAGDKDSALIYLMGAKEELSEVAQVLSETVSSSVTITGVLDHVDDSDVQPFDDAPSYAQLIGVASAIHQDRLAANFLSPRRTQSPEPPWQKIAVFGGLAALVLGVFGYIGSAERVDQLDQIEQRKGTIEKLAKRGNRSAELQDIVDAVTTWQKNDITWLDELKDLSDRFPERNESLVRKMTLSAADNGAGVVDLSVQVNSPEVITELESAIRDDRHSVSSKRVTEVSDSEELTWSFDTRIVFQPLPRPEKTLPDPVEDVTVDGVALDDSPTQKLGEEDDQPQQTQEEQIADQARQDQSEAKGEGKDAGSENDKEATP